MTSALPLLLVLLPALGSLLLLVLPERTIDSSAKASLIDRLVSSRAIALAIALAVLAFSIVATQQNGPVEFHRPWFRFQNLQVDIALVLRPTRHLVVVFLAFLATIACASIPSDERERPRHLAAGLLGALASTMAALLTEDLVVLVIAVELLTLPLAFVLVTRLREDSSSSATTVLAGAAIATASLLILALAITNLPLPIDGEGLALSASIARTREACGGVTAHPDALLIALALTLLPRALLFPTHWGYTLLQHRFSAAGAVFALFGGLALATSLFSELAASYCNNASFWNWTGARSHIVFALAACGMTGLAISANLRESLRRRVAAAILVPLHVVVPLLALGTAASHALASMAVLALGLPAMTLVLGCFAFARRRDPGRLRDLRGVLRRMPRLFVMMVAAIVLGFGVPGSAAWRVFERSFELLAARSMLLTIVCFGAILAAATSLVLVLLFSMRSEDSRRDREATSDLDAMECFRLALPLACAVALAIGFEQALAAQTASLVELGMRPEVAK
ncbi:MAG: hypothetical protein H6832_07120 [Planctomycetes bacterium]|nr:hypothetical protein [Planctomycetota bacterium]MCB9890341.1 hypothetical protein [Planctomycetota bacterium]MCB9918159.1 hypothetical protein [Planctomycetota bacterium]